MNGASQGTIIRVTIVGIKNVFIILIDISCGVRGRRSDFRPHTSFSLIAAK
jgi:hypothetical protein